MECSEWLDRLIVLHGMRGADRIAECHRRLLPVLSDLGPEAFTEDSLVVVRGKLRSLNAPMRLRAVVQEVAAAQRATSSLGDADPIGWLPYWHKRRAENFVDGSAANLLHLIRAKSPQVFEHLCETDTLAASIAVQRHWVREFHPPPTAEESAHVAAVAAALVGELHAASWSRAPRFTLSDQRDRLAGPAPLQPRYLTPEQLYHINPLPDGRKRHAPADIAVATDPTADAASEGADAPAAG